MTEDTTEEKPKAKEARALELLKLELEKEHKRGKGRGLYTDELAARTNLPFDEVRMLLPKLEEEGIVEKHSIEWDHLPHHVRINVKRGMSRFKWGLKA